jgi:transposase
MAISEDVRNVIVRMKAKGKNNNQIADLVGVSRRSVVRILNLHKSIGHILPLKSPGRPRKLSLRKERQIVRDFARRVKTSPAAVALEIKKKETGMAISPDSIRRVLHRAGLHGRRKLRKPLLSYRSRITRLNFARVYFKKDLIFWDHVIFTDETPFQIFPSPGGQWTWRRPNEQYLPQHITATVKHGGGTIQVWASLTSRGVGYMCRLDQGLDAETYITILEGEVRQTINWYFHEEAVTLQQDNSPVHTAGKVRAWFQRNNIAVLAWPIHRT